MPWMYDIMDFDTVVFIILTVFIYVLFATQAIAFETTLRELRRAILIPTVVAIALLAASLSIFHAASLQPTNKIFWSSEAITALIGVWSYIWLFPASWRLKRVVFPRLQKKYGLTKREYRELGKLTIINKKKIIEMWENRLR